MQKGLVKGIFFIFLEIYVFTERPQGRLIRAACSRDCTPSV